MLCGGILSSPKEGQSVEHVGWWESDGSPSNFHTISPADTLLFEEAYGYLHSHRIQKYIIAWRNTPGLNKGYKHTLKHTKVQQLLENAAPILLACCRHAWKYLLPNC